MNFTPSADTNGICATCHAEATESYSKSLHYTVRGFQTSLIEFSGDEQALENPHEGLGETFNLNCMNCHATCGECHVSRPSGYAGGLIDQHTFFSTPPMEQTCYGCHGARNAGEFMGTVGFARDVHFEAGMTCTDCHDVTNFHGDGTEYDSMWSHASLPSCTDCHDDVTGDNASNDSHKAHNEDLACQVCHAQANQNCFECHTDINDDRTSLTSHSDMRILFRIGLNPEVSENNPYKYVTLRHIPTTENTFDSAGENLIPNFDTKTNWKYSPTHNIQKVTFQNETCDSCHGNERIFLNERDLLESDSAANKALIASPPEKLGN